MNCIFCKIIARILPAEIILETDTLVVIKDIHPKAPVHYLIIPKKHVADIQSLENNDLVIARDIFHVAQQLSSQLSNASDFRLVSNNGATAGQIIFHLHVHFLSGKSLHQAP